MANLQPTVFTIEDNLQLCQIVYNLGAINWDHISYKMNEWGQMRGKPVVMKPMECQQIWEIHLRQAGLVPHTAELQIRLQYPYAPPNLELVKRLFVARLQELYRHIKEKEDAYHIIQKDIADIRKGAWDGKIARQKAQEVPVPPTASSSSSQLSSIDSPVPAPPYLAPEAQEGADDDTSQEDADASHEMEGVEEDVTFTEGPTKMDVDGTQGSSPPRPADDKPPENTTGVKPNVKEEKDQRDQGKTTDEDEDEDEDEEEGKEEESAPPARELRSRKPATEPIEIPAAAAAKRGKTRKASDSNTHASTRSSKRRGANETSKAPQSPATASAVGTLDSAPSPAGATDENASVVGEEGNNIRRSTRGHKRKASEMDVDLPVPSKKMRERSSTAEEDPMTAAVASGSRGSSKAMTEIVTLLTNSRHSEIFRKPVSKKDAPDYTQAVLKPMDLATILRNVKSRRIGSWDELQRDLRKMLANCCIYNRPGTTAYESAKLMLEEVEDVLKNAREAAQS